MGDACDPCAICHDYIHDYMTRPMRPDELLFKDVHHRRLQKIIPECIRIFERFFARLSDFEFSVAAFIIEKDVGDEKEEDVIKKTSWRSMTKWFIMLNSDYELIKCLIHENCISKKADELLGFWLSELFIVKEIHMEHSRPRIVKFVQEEDELYNV